MTEAIPEGVPKEERMQRVRSRWQRLAAASAMAVITCVAPLSAARAQGTQKTEAEFVSYDAAVGELTVRVVQGGSDATLERGQQVAFAVKPEGSVLDKTAVSSGGARADLSRVSEGQLLSLYWQWQTTGDQKVRFARRIDVAPASE